MKAVSRDAKNPARAPITASTTSTSSLTPLAILLACLIPSLLFAQTETNLADDIPPLRPPRAELPPGFWEQYGNSVLAGALAGLVLMLLVVWWLKVRRPQPELPPQTVARQALAQLHSGPENGLLLSRVSQILRRYFRTAFELTPGESTTTEFCAEVLGDRRLGQGLAEPLCGFLKRCDERKFAPAPGGPELNALATASELVDAGEARRAELRRAASVEEAGQRKAG